MSRLVTPEAQQLTELAALVADGPRLARGRGLYRRGSVGGIFVANGEVVASVRGSDSEPYEVVIAARAAPAHAEGLDLVPGAIDVAISCTCPDWTDLCKHGVAALLGFADEVDDDLRLLARWRGRDETAAAAKPRVTRSGSNAQVGPDDQSDSDRASAKGSKLEEALQGLAVTRGMPDAGDEPEPEDPLAEFFTGAMPSNGPVLDANVLHAVESLANPFAKVRMRVDQLDAAPHLAEALEVIAQFAGGRVSE